MKLRIPLFCIAFALTTATASAQDICAEIETLAASISDFSDLRGERIDDETWQSNLKLSLFDGCTIGTFENGLTFNCAKPYESEEALGVAHAEAADKIWACEKTNTRSYWETKGSFSGKTWSFFYGDMQFTVGAEIDIFTEKPQLSLMAFEA